MEILIGIAAIGIILVTLPALLALGGLIIGMLAPVIAVVVVLGLLGTFWNELEPLIAVVLGMALVLGIIGFVGSFILDLVSSPDDTGSSNPDKNAAGQSNEEKKLNVAGSERIPNDTGSSSPNKKAAKHPNEEKKFNVGGGEGVPTRIFVRRLLEEGISSENFDTEAWLFQQGVELRHIAKQDVDEMSISEAIEYNKAQEKLAELDEHKKAVERNLTIWNEFLSWAETESENELRKKVREGSVPPISITFEALFFPFELNDAMTSLNIPLDQHMRTLDHHKGSPFHLLWTYCSRVEILIDKWRQEGLRVRAAVKGGYISLYFHET